MSVAEIQAEELKQRLDQGDNLFLLDVRDEYEFEISNIGGHLIPLAELSKRFNELNARQRDCHCLQDGAARREGRRILQQPGFNKVSNLRGGIHAWSDKVDHKVRKY